MWPGAPLWAQDSTSPFPSGNLPATDFPIVESQSSNNFNLEYGQSKVITIDGQAPFASDDTIIKVEQVDPTHIRVTALTGGIGQVLYYNNGELKSINITITSPTQFINKSIAAKFIPYKPYFDYSFASSSSYTIDHFRMDPAYSHNLSFAYPYYRSSFTGGIGIQNQNLDSAHITATGVQYRYTNPRFIMELGQTVGSTLSQTNNNFIQTPALEGGRLQFKNFMLARKSNNKWLENLQVFGGVTSPLLINESSIHDKFFGFAYTIQQPEIEAQDQQSSIRHSRNTFANVSTLAFQPEGYSDFHLAGLIEENYNLPNTPYSIGTSTNISENGGFATRTFTSYDRKNSSLQFFFAYVNHNLQDTNLVTQDQNVYGFGGSGSSYFPNSQFYIGTNVVQTFTDPLSGPNTHDFFANINVDRFLSIVSSYGLGYGFNRQQDQTATTFIHNLNANLTYKLGMDLFAAHNVIYTLSDEDSTTHQVINNYDLTYEFIRAVYRLSAANIIKQGNGSLKNLRLSLLTRQQLTQAHSIDATLTYLRPNFNTSFHNLSFALGSNYNLTSTHFINTGLSFFDFWDTKHTIGGNINVNYSHLFGPGVRPDPIYRKFAGQSPRKGIKGAVFLDNNYNGILDEGDIVQAKIPVTLDGKKKTFTNVKGLFLFSGLKTGPHKILVDPQTLAPKEALDGDTEYLLTVSETSMDDSLMAYQIRRASLHVRLVLDANNNQKEDPEDVIGTLPSILLVDSANKEIKISGRGQATFRGLEKGNYTVKLDPAVIPDTYEVLDNLEKPISIDAYEPYTVSFLLKPVRTLSGQITGPDGIQNFLSKLEIHLGDITTNVDKDGYYWVKDIPVGEYDLQISNLPSGWCLPSEYQLHIIVSADAFVKNDKLILSKTCQ